MIVVVFLIVSIDVGITGAALPDVVFGVAVVVL